MLLQYILIRNTPPSFSLILRTISTDFIVLFSHMYTKYIYDFFVALCVISESMFTAVSYLFTLTIVIGIGSHREQLKAQNACISHICGMLIFHVPITL
jgi:hypothetical protein